MISEDASTTDAVRRDFIAAYAWMWKCTVEQAEDKLRHVEIVAVEEEVEAARAIRNSAEGQGLFNLTYFEGYDDALDRVMPTN